MSGATNKLELAQKHLEKVLIAWDDPTDWADLSLSTDSMPWKPPLMQPVYISASTPPNHMRVGRDLLSVSVRNTDLRTCLTCLETSTRPERAKHTVISSLLLSWIQRTWRLRLKSTSSRSLH